MGNDLLIGNWGSDTLTGGGGKDTFQWLKLQLMNSDAGDRITDFGLKGGTGAGQGAAEAGVGAIVAVVFLVGLEEELLPHARTLAPQAIELLCAYRWPGNVRELENKLKTAVIMADGNPATAAALAAAGMALAREDARGLEMHRRRGGDRQVGDVGDGNAEIAMGAFFQERPCAG